MATANLTAQRLRELLSYDSSTGQFTRIAHCSHRVGRTVLGPMARRPNAGGYIVISLDNIARSAHRLAWMYVYGEWPQGMIDHINGVKTDNRIANLRLCDAATNQQNLRGAKAGNSIGLLGVTPCKESGRFISAITHGRKRIHLGRFDTPELAHAAYLGAKRVLHTHGTM
jgi:hypothetical protein